MLWRALLRQHVAAPQTWVLRDFHSPNLIWLRRHARASSGSG